MSEASPTQVPKSQTSRQVHELPAELTFEQAHHDAIADVNRWRGHCLELHARLERAVNAALAHWKPDTARPQKMSDRLRALRELTGPEGTRPSAALHDLLGELAEQRNGWRDRLAHATSTVHLDENRHWVWHFTMPRSGQKQEDDGAVSFADGRVLEEKLGRNVNALRSKLGQLKIPNCR